jgi:hypothetical protein
MNEFFTWAMLATFAGASLATTIITQFIKGALSKVPTQIVSYVVALVVLLLATAATGAAADWTGWAIVPLNAILVSVAANGTFSAIVRVKDGGNG